MQGTDNDLSSFGVLLKAFRKCRHLTQQQLAEAIGMHRSAIVRWEQGDFLPGSKTLVLELARHLHLDDQETRHLLEASLTALAPHWYVPLPRNPFFTGREEILEALHAHLSTGQVVALTHSYALHGLGGIGKTQIALEYAYRHALSYRAVFWIEAETEETVISSLLHSAEVLQLPERQQTDQQRMVEAVQRWLSSHSGWLLIWDNLEKLDLLHCFLPAVRSGAILMTTRNPALATRAVGMDLLPMGREEGMLFVLRRAKVLEPTATWEQVRQFARDAPTDYAAAEEVVTVLGGLPLALDQAGAYVEETGCSLGDYVQRYQQQRARLLARRGSAGELHPHSVAATFHLSSEQAQREQPAAADLLRVCAVLHAEQIPEELFVAGAAHLGPDVAALGADAAHFDQAVAVLRRLSLVQRQAQTHTLSLHRLVQAVLRESMSQQEQAVWLNRVMAALNAAFPEVTPRTWGQCERLLPHVLTVAAALPESAEDQDLAEALQKAARYLCDHGRYAQAEPLYQRALRIGQQIWGETHPQVAETLCDLACLSSQLGQYQRAELLFQRVLCIWERVLGPAHPALARPLHGLGRICWKQGNYDQAEQAYQRAYSILEQAQEAEPLYEAQLLNGLGILAFERGQDAQAERFYQRALERSQQLGETHPDLANPLNNLAELYREQGKYDQAQALYQRALHIWQHTVGETHPHVAHPLDGLALLYTRQGKYEQAEPLYERALSVREQYLGQDHPETAQTLHDLALLRQQQGRRDEALSLAERALQICSQSLGDAHPQTVAACALAAQVAEALPNQVRKEHVEEAVITAQTSIDCAQSENDPLQEFLTACCELHPRAWCRSADLWLAYTSWVADHQERFPLSRREFAAQLQAQGYQADRTNKARIWRGMMLRSPACDVT
jgi:tetratricopeptide (TPR) repeat protein/transcriptional regulator with XRE-family HTH domain